VAPQRAEPDPEALDVEEVLVLLEIDLESVQRGVAQYG
jgi:hypothetical protein